MKKFFAVSVLEVSLILMFVAITSYFGWQAFTNKTFDLLKLSTITQNSALQDINAFLNPLNQKLNDLMKFLNDNNGANGSIGFNNDNSNSKGSNTYNAKRVETTGVIGQLIAAYKQAKLAGASSCDKLKDAAIDALKDLILSDQGKTSDNATPEQKTEAESKADVCFENPQSCTTLMTVTTISGVLTNSNLSDKYYGGKFPVTLNYEYKYIDNNGKQQVNKITQTVYIQKEQNASQYGKTYAEFLPQYLQSKISAEAATGSATNVQTLMDKYTTGKNSILSKSSGQYYDFSTHTMYYDKNNYCYANPSSCKD